MIYTGKILSDKGAPVLGASLSFKTDTGELITTIPVNGMGAWSLDSDFDNGLLNEGVIANFSAPGYYTYSVSSVTIPQTFNVKLTKKPNLIVPFALGAGTLLLLSGQGNRMLGKAVPESKGLPRWVLPVTGIALGAGLIWHFFNKPDPKSQDSAQLATAAADKINQLAAQGKVPTISSATAESMSSAIVEATTDWGTDEESIYNTFAQLSNEADLWLLIKVFGVRMIHAFFGGNYFGDTPYNLPQIITAELSSGERSTLNAILQQKGINYQF